MSERKCKLKECQGKPRCGTCLALDASYFLSGAVARAQASQPPQGASSLLPGWKLSLDESASELLRDTIGAEDHSPITLSLGDGADGPGLYVWLTEYPEEGAILLAASPLPAPQEPADWSDQVEQRLLTWRQRFMNKSGDQLALDDFMGQESIDDLIDFVCAPLYAAPAPQEPAVCKWTRDDFDSSDWNTDCGERYTLNEGTPGDNMMRFCCYCGKPVESCEPDDYAAPAPVDPESQGSSERCKWDCDALQIARENGFVHPDDHPGLAEWLADRPISATQPASPARDDVLETLRELVVGLDITHWSSWQTTAYFWDQLEAARRLLEDRALREQG